MIPEDAERFYAALDGVLELTGKELSDPARKLWWEALAAYPAEDVVRALFGHVRNPDAGQFMPKPADIIRQLEGDSESAALSAWHKVLQALQMAGSGESVVFDDPAIHGAISDMGGWIELGRRLTDDEEPFFRQQFAKLYRAKWGNPGDYPAKLMGRFEAENRRDGWPSHIGPPTLIGNPEKAKAVLNQGSQGAALSTQSAGGQSNVVAVDFNQR